MKLDKKLELFLNDTKNKIYTLEDFELDFNLIIPYKSKFSEPNVLNFMCFPVKKPKTKIVVNKKKAIKTSKTLKTELLKSKAVQRKNNILINKKKKKNITSGNKFKRKV